MKEIFVKQDNLEELLRPCLLEEEEAREDVENTVREMIKSVKTGGFKALADYTRKYDQFELTEENFRVSKEEIKLLAQKCDPALSKALEVAVARVRSFHELQFQKSYDTTDELGNHMGQKVVPLNSAAIYVPGGLALYPSTLYMTAIPAIIAGVKRIVLLSPPRTFTESPEVARLIQILGIEEVYRAGGAQGIIAAALGAGPLKGVDKIAGPGNIYVATAKSMLYGTVDIDMIAGPSEILVIVDSEKDEDIPLIAADLLSQAEHGPAGWTRSTVVGTNPEFLKRINEELYVQARSLPDQQKNNALASLDARGLAITCPDLDTAVAVSNFIAPEHLELFSLNPYPLLEKITNAGSVFLGRYTPESVGDYIGGPNHVLPTARTARFFSPLGVYSFQKKLSWIEFSEKSLVTYLDEISTIARAEKLEAHARAAEVRFK